MPLVQQPTNCSSLPPQGVPTRMWSISSLHKAQDKPKIHMAPTPAPAVLTMSLQQHQQCLWLQHCPCVLTTWLVHLLQHYKREVLTCPLLTLIWGDHHDQQLLQNWGPLSMLCRHWFCHWWIVITTHDYDPDTFSFSSSSLILTTPASLAWLYHYLSCCSFVPFLLPPLYSYHSLAPHSLAYDS